MYKVFIGGYIDFVYFIILDGFNGIIGGKIRNEVMIFFVIFMKLIMWRIFLYLYFVINVFVYFLYRCLLE